MKMHSKLAAATLAGLLIPTAGLAQNCSRGIRVEVVVLDPNGSSVAAAQVQAADGETAMTDAAGHFMLPCVPSLIDDARRKGSTIPNGKNVR